MHIHATGIAAQVGPLPPTISLFILHAVVDLAIPSSPMECPFSESNFWTNGHLLVGLRSDGHLFNPTIKVGNFVCEITEKASAYGWRVGKW